MSSQHLTKWQRFKIWTTKYFGCKSSSTYVFNNNEQNDNSERPSKQSGQRIQPSKSINGQQKHSNHDQLQGKNISKKKHHQQKQQQKQKQKQNVINKKTNVDNKKMKNVNVTKSVTIMNENGTNKTVDNKKTKSLGVMDLHDDNGQDIPFIDASLINLDRIVK
ncbi:uncharacterized protein LOC113797348 [Dermatophagoides pteronyssinus]|uniref:Uncharacterized protein LOC113797348 n=1 Tax=Dermatophagoides pteronyssinus TaxID=6956 RepID=A0A6P6YF38_DERPT|nr:uncharacterized protein LOC113797348 [Dermatophagoides pteronyssinus]